MKKKTIQMVSLLIVLFAGVITAVLLPQRDKTPLTAGSSCPVTGSGQPDSRVSSDSGKQDDGQLRIPGFERLTFRADQKKQTVSFGNPPENTCYFVVSLKLRGGDEIYRSGLLSPGNSIKEIALNKPLEAGSYTAVLTYETYTFDEARLPLNGADMEVDLTVKN